VQLQWRPCLAHKISHISFRIFNRTQSPESFKEMKLLSTIGILLALSISFAFAGKSTFKKFPGGLSKKNYVPRNIGKRILKGNSKKGSIVKKNKRKGARASTNTEPTIIQSYVNWAVCLHDRTSNKACSPQLGVPKGYYFLDPFVVYSSCSNTTIPVRKCNVPVDPKGEPLTVVIPVVGDVWIDYDDNPKGGICNESRPTGNDPVLLYPKTNVATDFFKYTQLPYAFVNGRSLSMEYIIEDEPFYLKSCSNKVQCCDDCDVPSCVDCGGVDQYPTIGYVSTDTSTWKPGEKRYYQWGYGYEVDACDCSGCSMGRVELTAVEKK